MDGGNPLVVVITGTAVVDIQLYLWGGDQYVMPLVHDSAEKRQFFSSVEVFDVNTGMLGAAHHTWNTSTGSEGAIPVLLSGMSCTFRWWVWYTVSAAKTVFTHWAPPPCNGGCWPPQQQRVEHQCSIEWLWNGALHFMERRTLLYVVGGLGHAAPSSPQRGAQYQPYGDGMGILRTNEQHIFSLSTSEWYCVVSV